MAKEVDNSAHLFVQNNKFHKILIILTLLALSSVSAVSSASNWKWKFQQITSADYPNGLCMIYAGDPEGKTDLNLEIVRAKGGLGPAEIFLRESKKPTSARSWLMDIETKQTLGFTELSNDGKERLFWHLPVKTGAVIKYLSQKALNIDAVGGGKKIRVGFPASGFEEALKTLQNKCLGGQALVDTDFEARFLQNVTVSGDLTNKTQADTRALRELFHTAYDLDIALGNNSKKIDEIVARYKSVVDEYNTVTSRINFLVQTEIPNLTAEIEKQKTDRKNAEKTLREVTALLPKLEAQVVQDQATLNSALAKRAPYNAENDRLENILDDAQSALNSAENRLRSILSSISETNDRLRRAEGELAILRRNLSGYESEVRRSESDLQNARRQRDQFDEQRELHRRLDSSYEVSRLRSDLQRAEQEEHRYASEAVTAEQRHRAAQRQLAQCQTTAGADCSAQQSEVDQTRSQLEQARSNFENAKRDSERARSNLDREVDQIERQVQEETRHLDREVADASERYNQAVRVHDEAVREVRNLEYTVIPDLQRDLRDLDREESVARQDIASLESQVQRASNDLERYRASVGWKELTERIRVAQSALNQSTQSRDAALKLKAQQEGIIAYTIRKQNELEGTLLQRSNELASLQAREKQLSATIEKYRQERAPFDLEAKRLQDLIASARASYKAIVEK